MRRRLLQFVLSPLERFSTRISKKGFNTIKQFYLVLFVFALFQYILTIAPPFNELIARQRMAEAKVIIDKHDALLWTGEQQRNPALELEHVQKIEIVLAYCKSDISWLADELVHYVQSYRRESDNNDNDHDHDNDVPELKITILSKCGNTNSIPDFANDINKQLSLDLGEIPTSNSETVESNKIHVKVDVEIVNLVNKGGCDLAYLHYINRYIMEHTAASAANTIIVFLKDSPRTNKSLHQSGGWRTVPDMIDYAARGEFICGIKTSCQKSVFHDSVIMKKYTIPLYVRHGDASLSGEDFNVAKYKNLKDFMNRELNWNLPNEELTEVCYGGTFAVPASRLFAHPILEKDLKHFEQILLDGPQMSIVEHFAERLWAAFLANPLNEKDTATVIELRESFAAKNGSYMGTLMSSRIKGCEEDIKF
jgi:hypothetical protein